MYELELGVPGLQMPLLSAAGAGPEVAEYWRTLSREENRYYQAGLLEAEDL